MCSIMAMRASLFLVVVICLGKSALAFTPPPPLAWRFFDTFVEKIGDKLDYAFNVSQISPDVSALIYYDIGYRQVAEFGFSQPEKLAKMYSDASAATFGRLTPHALAQVYALASAHIFFDANLLNSDNVDALAEEFAVKIQRAVDNYPYDVYIEALEDGYLDFVNPRNIITLDNIAKIFHLNADYLYYVVGDI